MKIIQLKLILKRLCKAVVKNRRTTIVSGLALLTVAVAGCSSFPAAQADDHGCVGPASFCDIYKGS
jgi:hypothetical protein